MEPLTCTATVTRLTMETVSDYVEGKIVKNTEAEVQLQFDPANDSPLKRGLCILRFKDKAALENVSIGSVLVVELDVLNLESIPLISVSSDDPGQPEL